MAIDLKQRSIEIILEHQAPSGAYIASPNFPTYHYAWFRDGAFCAYAMDVVGEHESARRFHSWAARVVNSRSQRIHQALERTRRGLPLRDGDILHTRFTLQGADVPRDASEWEWPNFQLDGFGTWLWALAEHRRLTQTDLEDGCLQAAGLTADYLTALWQQPCFDCWEEFPDRIHTHTLAAIYGGLHAYARLSGSDQSTSLQAIQKRIFDNCLADGHFIKYPGTSQVDASLLGLATPYRLVEPGDPRFQATVACIEQTLASGGVHRYSSDTYYGGGEWVLLAGWLGWAQAEAGQRGRSLELLRWIEAQAGPDGSLPEQVPASLIEPSYLEQWEHRWGPIANPLLWSHAMYLILGSKAILV